MWSVVGTVLRSLRLVLGMPPCILLACCLRATLQSNPVSLPTFIGMENAQPGISLLEYTPHSILARDDPDCAMLSIDTPAPSIARRFVRLPLASGGWISALGPCFPATLYAFTRCLAGRHPVEQMWQLPYELLCTATFYIAISLPDEPDPKQQPSTRVPKATQL